MDFQKLKPLVKDFIKYYYDDLENGAGGFLHIVLDDGNIEHSFIAWCREQCEENKDSFGIFLGSLLLQFSEDELETMYEYNWWGMRQGSIAVATS